MKFAKWLFWIAGAFGLAAIYPRYHMPGTPTCYGLLATLIAWQAAFFVIGSNPTGYRWLVIPAVLKKR